jgi:radical SAM protein with 4Fe4S-binding SPASM domain
MTIIITVFQEYCTQMKPVPMYPKSIWIEPTNICNLKCSWCYQSTGSMNRKKGSMTLETYNRIISEIKPFKPEISLHLAGESLLHKDFFTFVEIAKENGLVVGVTTNGTLLRKDDFKILKTGIDTVNVSLAGTDKEDYLRVRGTDDFDVIKQDIIELAKRKKELKSPTKIYLNVTATEQNSARLDTFKSEFESIEGIEGVLIRPLMDWQGSLDTGKMKVKGSGTKSRLAKTVRGNEVLLSLYMVTRNVRKSRRLRGRTYCSSVCSSAGILWDGTVVPCCLDYNGSIDLGNINEKRFMEIWNGEAMARLRKTLRSVRSAKQHPVCGPCLFGIR